MFADEAEGKQLLEHLDGLPLAIAQAGAFLQESGMHLKKYLRLYEERRTEIAELLHGSDAPLEDYPNRSILTTWNISYGSILQQDEHVANLLVLWSFLDRNDVWYGLFQEAIGINSIAKELSKWLGSIASQESSFIAAMKLLRGYSLIEGSEHTDGYSMHAVVHRWAYFYQGLRHKSEIGMLGLAIVGFAVPMKTERNYARLQQRLLPHAQVCSLRALGMQRAAQDDAGDSHFVISSDHLEEKDVLNAMNMLGLLYSDQGKLEEAEKMYIRALQGYEEALGPKHTFTLNTVNNLGILYSDQGKLEEAEKMYIRALQGKEEALGPKHTSTLNTINNLGLLYSDQGKLDEAEKMYIRALSGYTVVRGASSNICIDLSRHLSALNVTKQQDISPS